VATSVPSFVSYSYSLLKRRPASGVDFEEYTIKSVAASLYLAGSDMASVKFRHHIGLIIDYLDIIYRYILHRLSLEPP